MPSAVFDKAPFIKRLKLLYKCWMFNKGEHFQLLPNVDAFICALGTDNHTVYSKSSSLQIWLFGYELTDTLCVFTNEKAYILASKKKFEFLKPALNIEDLDCPSIHVMTRNKSSEEESLEESYDDESEFSEASEISNSEEKLGSSDESGKDWSELEREAAEEDRDKNDFHVGCSKNKSCSKINHHRNSSSHKKPSSDEYRSTGSGKQHHENNGNQSTKKLKIIIQN